MRDDQRGGASVYVRGFGSGPNRALLLHCALAHSKVWAPLAAELSDQLTMVAPDMPGHGRSAAFDGTHDLHDEATGNAAANLDTGAHVIGHSFGATVALRLAMECPAKVQSLTLIEPVLFAAAAESDSEAFATYVAASQGFGNALREGDWAVAAAKFISIWGDGRPWEALSEKERNLFAQQMPFILETEPCLLEDANRLLAAGRLEGITCPTQLIRGANSEPVIAAIHATLASRIPNAKDIVISGAGHMVPITHPEPVAEQIRSLLQLAAA
ncbi:alpha/beta fold hydrolase [Marivita sp.]|uniref:alpha/beta fold hydrolase n=1 Tax=Marivita sp. TaxID=2003365 RepID=UPI003F6C42A7